MFLREVWDQNFERVRGPRRCAAQRSAFGALIVGPFFDLNPLKSHGAYAEDDKL